VPLRQTLEWEKIYKTEYKSKTGTPGRLGRLLEGREDWWRSCWSGSKTHTKMLCNLVLSEWLSSIKLSGASSHFTWMVSKQMFPEKIWFDIHESMHRDMIMKVTNKMQLYRLIYYSYSALHVSGDVFAHHQEHLTAFTVSGSWNPSFNSSKTPAGSNLGEYYQIL